ncbi:hypothetical protein FACS1894156_4740 [Bacteroidia bacterium]|nr:hypothetical protein FACS1894156_4740 [Bacteroidia bacterium]
MEDIQNLDLEAINRNFNVELQQQIGGTLPKGHVYQMGMPGLILQSAGISYLPIELSADRLQIKAGEHYRQNHPFDLVEINDLPSAINSPIAVFDSTKKDNSKVILTELQHEDSNFIAILRVRHSANSRKLSVEVNSVRSIYPKGNVLGIVDWINSKDELLRWIDKEKAMRFISTQSTHLIAGGNKTQDLINTAKIINNFENPTILAEKSQKSFSKSRLVG